MATQNHQWKFISSIMNKKNPEIILHLFTSNNKQTMNSILSLAITNKYFKTNRLYE